VKATTDPPGATAARPGRDRGACLMHISGGRSDFQSLMNVGRITWIGCLQSQGARTSLVVGPSSLRSGSHPV